MRTHRSVVHRALALSLAGLAMLTLLAALYPLRAADEKTPWQLQGWKYRRPVLVYNASTMDKTGLIVALNDFPFVTLVNDGKLAPDARDLRLVDEDGKDTVPLRADYLMNDSGKARLAFFVPEVARGERKYFWLYYGNPQAKPAPALDPEDTVPFFENVGASFGAEEGLAPEPAADAGAQLRWVAPFFLAEGEAGKIDGDAAVAKLTGPAGLQVSQSALVAFRDAGKGTVTLEVTAPAGETNCWVRYCPSTVNEATRGALAIQLAQGGNTLAQQRVDLRPKGDEEEAGPDDDPLGGMKPDVEEGDQKEIERTGYRWLSLRATTTAGKATVTVTGEKTLAGVDCVLLTKDLKYVPDVRDFQNRVWVRFRYNAPAGSRFFTYVDNQIRYTIKGRIMSPTGDVGYYGLRPALKPALDKLENDFIPAGQYTEWVLLPVSDYDTWYSEYNISVPEGRKYDYAKTTLDMQFATRPSTTHLFHVTKGETADTGPTAHVRMPTDLSWEGVNRIESFGEWAQRRLELVTGLKLGPPPRLKRVRVGNWASTGSPDAGLDRLKNEFGIQENLGCNMVFGTYLPNDLFEKMAKEHGLIDVNSIAWPCGLQMAPGTWKGDTVDGWLEKNVTQPYVNWSAAYKKDTPFAAELTTRFNMMDEIGPAVDAKTIQVSPGMMTHFHDYLKKQGLTPQTFGMETWEDVNPIDDRRILGQAGPPKRPGDEVELPPDDPDLDVKNPGLAAEGPKYPPEKSLAAAKLFYFTRRYIDYYTGCYYKRGTDVLLKEFPKARIISPNYQAGPMQMAFLGNNNDTDKGQLDIFHLSRTHSFFGLQIEDWVGGNDFGVGRECFGTEIMRSAARKYKDNTCALQVGGEAIKYEMFGFLMHGAKDLDSYLYGPLQNIGPAWGDYKESNASIAQFTREIKPFDEAIGDGDIRPRKAAILVAYTGEFMQQRGVGHCPLRQNTYIALEHSYVPVDVVCEQEITEDEVLKKYSLLFVTDPQTTTAVQQKIAAWVKAGGRLWAGAGALNWDEYNQPSPILNEVLGVAKRTLVDHEVKDGAPTTTLTADAPHFGGKVTLPVWGETLEIQPTTAKVLGRYADGTPAVTLNSYGAGEAMLVGALVGNSYTRLHFATNILDPNWKFELGADASKLLGGLLASAKVEKPVVLSLPGIYTAVWDTPQGTLVFLNNATYAALWNVKDRRPAPQVTARIRVPGPVKSVQSKNGEVKFTQAGNEVTVQLALPDTDILLLK